LLRPTAARPGGDIAPALARFVPDGSLDRDFGVRGVVVLPLSGFPTGVALDRQGRIVVSGGFKDPSNTNVLYGAVRLLPDGTLDTSFGEGGLLRIDPGTVSALQQVTEAADGSLLVVERGNDLASRLVRLSAEGSIDPSFGDGGRVELGLFGAIGGVDSQGRVLVANGTRLLRFAPDGTPDAEFGTDVRRGPHGGVLFFDAARTDARDRVVVSGFELGRGRGLYRFDSSGVLDVTFGDGGSVASSFTWQDAQDYGPFLRLDVGGAARERYVTVSESAEAPRSHAVGQVTGIFFEALDASQAAPIGTFQLRDSDGAAPTNRFVRDVAVGPFGATAYVVGLSQGGSWDHRRSAPLLVRIAL
jgi:uncharacterized delta-60 repeat protein